MLFLVSNFFFFARAPNNICGKFGSRTFCGYNFIYVLFFSLLLFKILNKCIHNLFTLLQCMKCCVFLFLLQLHTAFTYLILLWGEFFCFFFKQNNVLCTMTDEHLTKTKCFLFVKFESENVTHFRVLKRIVTLLFFFQRFKFIFKISSIIY